MASTERAQENCWARVEIRGKAEIEEGARSDFIVITELPYQVNKAALIEKIAQGHMSHMAYEFVASGAADEFTVKLLWKIDDGIVKIPV